MTVKVPAVLEKDQIMCAILVESLVIFSDFAEEQETIPAEYSAVVKLMMNTVSPVNLRKSKKRQ